MTEHLEHSSTREAWAAVQSDARALAKVDRNKGQGYNFRGIDAVLNLVGPILRRHGAFVTPDVIELRRRDVTYGSKGTAGVETLAHIRWSVRSRWDDDEITGSTWGESIDSSDKGVAQAQSVAARVWFLNSLALPTDDPEPDHRDAAEYGRNAGQPAAPVPAGADPATVAALVERSKTLPAEQAAALKSWMAERQFSARTANARQAVAWGAQLDVLEQIAARPFSDAGGEE